MKTRGHGEGNVEKQIETLIEMAKEILDHFALSDTEMQMVDEYLQKAIDLGSVEAMYLLGQEYDTGYMLTQNIPKAIELYTIAAEKRHQKAVNRLINIYYYDTSNEKRYEQAMEIIDKYSNLDNGHAYYFKGWMYLHGQGVANDTKSGLQYLDVAAKWGHDLRAIKLLEEFYEYGHELFDISQDLIKAAFYHDLAAQQGDKESQYKLAMVKLKGIGTTTDYHGAYQWLWKSALQSYGMAQVELAKFYVSGNLFPKDVSTALLWLLISQNNIVCEEAKTHITECEKEISKAKLTKLQKEAIRLYKNMKHITEGKSELLLLPDKYLELNGFNAEDEVDDNMSGRNQSTQVEPEGDEPVDDTIYPPTEASHERVSQLGKINKISDLFVTFYPNNGKVTFAYQDHKFTTTFLNHFSENCKELLIRHDKHINHGESPVAYYDSNIYDKEIYRERPNRQIVYDFNYALRKLLGIAKDQKPFVWVGKGKDRLLMVNFTLSVKYKPPKRSRK